MGVWYQLANYTRKERVTFAYLSCGMKAWELTANATSAAVTTWYLLQHPGDQIAFVGDELEWPFPTGSHDDLETYPDVTDIVVEQLIAEEILYDRGIVLINREEQLYYRDVRHSSEIEPEQLRNVSNAQSGKENNNN